MGSFRDEWDRHVFFMRLFARKNVISAPELSRSSTMLFFAIGLLIPAAAIVLANWRWAVSGLSLAVFCGSLMVIFTPPEQHAACADNVTCAVAGVAARVQLALNAANLPRLPGQGG
jgi:hypothetical protein